MVGVLFPVLCKGEASYTLQAELCIYRKGRHCENDQRPSADEMSSAYSLVVEAPDCIPELISHKILRD